MKHLLLLIFILIPFSNLNSQTKWDTIYKKRYVKVDGKKVLKIDTIYKGTNNYSDPLTDPNLTKPIFPGGIDALYGTIKQNIRYPKELADKKISGMVMVKFTIDSLGWVKNPIIIKTLHPLLDQEALRVVSSLPRWVPATKNGELMSSEMVIPITFKF
jgi:TonB family protein